MVSAKGMAQLMADVWTGSFHNRHALVKSFHLAAPSLDDSKRFLETLMQNSNRVHGTATSTRAWGTVHGCMARLRIWVARLRHPVPAPEAKKGCSFGGLTVTSEKRSFCGTRVTFSLS
jgi:hypothetical protein